MDDGDFYPSNDGVCLKDVPMPIVDLETASDDEILSLNNFTSMAAEEIHYLDKYLESEEEKLNDLGVSRGKSARSEGFVCEVCQKVFTCSTNLHTHKIYTHENRPRKYKCDQCEGRFIFRMDLERHYAKHSKSKDYQCSVCGKLFGFQSSLSNHTRHHHLTEAQKHKCVLCQATFGVLANLKRHEKVHLANRQCPDCGKMCQSEYHLRVHEMTHLNGNKCFNCSVCNVAFVRKTFLNKHMRLKHPKA